VENRIEVRGRAWPGEVALASSDDWLGPGYQIYTHRFLTKKRKEDIKEKQEKIKEIKIKNKEE
jgi:hypothetical protein